jgi:hypothetical protein
MSPSQTATATLPNLFIIGAAKCGTTSLHRYLDRHPEISMSEPKEPRVFCDAGWEDRLPDYARMFARPGAPVRGESSTRYSRFPVTQHVPARVAAVCPGARLIYMVRDPVDCVVANWTQRYADMNEHRTLDNALRDLDQPANFYVAAGRFATQLEQWLEHFDHSQILVLEQAELRNDRAALLGRVLEFLQVRPEVPAGVDEEFNVSEAKERMTPAAARLWFTLAPATRRLPDGARRRLASTRLFPVEKIGRPALDADLRAALERELRGEAERFRKLTGMKFASWSI